MTIMQKARVTVDADAIAKGVLAMMRERHAMTDDAEDSEVLIRFGMLPKRWMDLIEKSMWSVVEERFQVTDYERRKDSVTTMIRTADDYEIVTFQPSKLIAEMVHEVSLALYSNVEMVV
jgi:hypothetical protein